jgi:hypothetical protein
LFTVPRTPDVPSIRQRFGDDPLLFELIPPTQEAGEDVHENRRQCLEELFSTVSVGAINLPEVQEESKKNDKGERRSDFKERVPPREYARQLSREHGELNFVINRVIVQEKRKFQARWLAETYHEYGIENVVVVGGESSDIDYPGPSVTEGNTLIKDELNTGEHEVDRFPDPTDFRVGNICISTRRKDDFDEPDRMIKKINSGADFFTTQIVAERESPVDLLRDLSMELDQQNVEPPAIFWSFSPIAEQKDVDFLRWLGVNIPDEVESDILSSRDPVEASIDHARSIWDELNEVNETLPVTVPMGLNISFMGDRNFRNAIRLADTLQPS